MLAQPIVAVVPLADGLPVQPVELGGERRIQIGVRVAADGTVGGIEREVDQVVHVGEQAHLAELGHAGEEAELDVRVALLDDRVQPAQRQPVGFGNVRSPNGIEERLVVFVHQDGHALAGALVQLGYQVPKPGPRAVAGGGHAEGVFHPRKLWNQVLRFPVGIEIVAAAEVDANDRAAHGPIPAIVDGEPPEQRLAALE